MSKVARFGHNGPPVFESAEDIRDVPNMHYFKLDIEALWKVLVELPLDVGGMYMRMLLSMYRHMEGLPADDNLARMRLGGIDIRTYRRIKAVLLAHPGCLVQRPSGRISNTRFEEEVTAYVVEYRNRQEAALAREEKKRQEAQIAPTSAGLRPDFRETSAGLPGEVGGKSAGSRANQNRDLSEKINEINGGATTVLPERAPQADHEVGVSYKLGVSSYKIEEEREVIYAAEAAEEAASAAKPRGSRLAEDWALPQRWGVWALETFQVTEGDVRFEADAFKDFWTSKTGAHATKLDWEATWRNWCRNQKRWRKRLSARPVAAPDLISVGTTAPLLPDEHAAEIAAVKALRAKWAAEEGDQ